MSPISNVAASAVAQSLPPANLAPVAAGEAFQTKATASLAAEQPPHAASLGNPDASLRALEEKLQTYQADSDHFAADVANGSLRPDSADYRVRSESLMRQSMQLQWQAQHFSMGVEIVSKVVEHGTTSTRTILQTQS